MGSLIAPLHLTLSDSERSKSVVVVVVVVVVFYFQTAYNNTSTMESSLILISNFTQFEAVARAIGCGCALIYNKMYFSLAQVKRIQLAKALVGLVGEMQIQHVLY